MTIARLILVESLSHFCVTFCSVEGLTLTHLLMYLFLLMAQSHQILVLVAPLLTFLNTSAHP